MISGPNHNGYSNDFHFNPKGWMTFATVRSMDNQTIYWHPRIMLSHDEFDFCGGRFEKHRLELIDHPVARGLDWPRDHHRAARLTSYMGTLFEWLALNCTGAWNFHFYPEGEEKFTLTVFFEMAEDALFYRLNI